MAEEPPKLVVRTYAPARGRLVALGVTLLAALALYITYEYGRFDGGYDRLAARQLETEYEVSSERLEKTIRELRLKLAEADTLRIGQTRERAELAKTIGELQAQVAQQSQELAFYKGIVIQGANAAEVKVQQMRVDRTDRPRVYRLRLTLVQPVRPDSVVSGTVQVLVEGVTGGRPLSLDLPALTGGDTRDLPFTFRYFENIDPEITLPEGFTPERVSIEVRSTRKGITPVMHTELWNVEA
jgi:hypothetical protein